MSKMSDKVLGDYSIKVLEGSIKKHVCENRDSTYAYRIWKLISRKKLTRVDLAT